MWKGSEFGFIHVTFQGFGFKHYGFTVVGISIYVFRFVGMDDFRIWFSVRVLGFRERIAP